MARRLKILYASPEMVPFAKTGGLADVAGALPQALAARGHEVCAVMPRHQALYNGSFALTPSSLPPFSVPVAQKTETVEAYELPERKDLRFVFISHEGFFRRPELYRDPETGSDYDDNDERFAYFSRAVLEWCKRADFRPDILHVNDWQAALIPTYLKTEYAADPFFAETRTVLTIHNLAYHGLFPGKRFGVLGLDPSYYAPLSFFEFYGKVDFLKAGICYADKINTVSETYSREIQSGPDFGCGLEGVLQQRSADLYGIVNGIDYSVWNPETDSLIPVNYSSQNLTGKLKNKEELMEECGFKLSHRELPVLGVISRLDDQKGFDLLAEIAERLFERDLLFVLLGTGAEKYHQLFETLQQKYPNKFHAFLTFDNRLAHLIEAGADMFLMPSRYEPCGLNQLYSLKYGTVPIVRRTGGLADTVEDADLTRGSGTGFVFDEYSGQALLEAIDRGLGAFALPAGWKKIMANGMAKDFSWAVSAAKYERLYHAASIPEISS